MFDSAPDPELPATAIRPQPRALQQSPEFARALMACGQDPLMLEDKLVLQRRLPGGLRLAMVNRADLTDPAPLLAAMRENGFARTPLILSPETPALHLSRLGAVPLVTPAHAAIWDLSGDLDQRRAALHQKWRNRLKHGAAQNLRLTRQNLPHDVRHWLFQADAKQQTLRGYRSWPIGLTLAYARENKGQAKLFQASEGKEAVAAILILSHGSGATYHIAHTTARGKQLSAHTLLLWEAANWLAAKGICRLDLGLINTEDAAGLARFKLGTGANLHRLGGTWGFWPPLGRILRPLARLDHRLMGA
ncbi:GNAT family N-acetyltransferase [Leisingera sp. McT4-56]|uniref:GNAT family N-acetyltransferase n=1 Tax=Leisingera sp. McT4-56 TaxID=2881255 RepID=UPI001CF8C344|nr:GNAT family N-acetyltransferase [Leisingera sp. McT4-56]MCB4454443.1 GNAT family N-acetyltransferase [Leisingera sp. McT4-56]